MNHAFSPSRVAQTLMDAAHRGKLLGTTVFLVACSSVVHAQPADTDWVPGQVIDKIYQSDPHDEVRKLLRRGKYEQALVLVKKNVAQNRAILKCGFGKATSTSKWANPKWPNRSTSA